MKLGHGKPLLCKSRSRLLGTLTDWSCKSRSHVAKSANFLGGDGNVPSGVNATKFVHPQFFPFYVVKITDLLTMEMPAPSHTDLFNRGLLHLWHPDMFSIFVSHQWLGRFHPDPDGSQLNILRESLLKLTNGSASVECNLVSIIHGQLPDWSADMGKTVGKWFHLSGLGFPSLRRGHDENLLCRTGNVN